MVITFSDNYGLSILGDTATIVWARILVTTIKAISQPAASVNINCSNKIMSLYYPEILDVSKITKLSL
jgi:hypothetical protein